MIVLVLTFVLSVIFCGLYLRAAHRWQLVDTPNARSSHTAPTPHGGGVALILAFVLGVVAADGGALIQATAYQWLVAGALLLMVLGVLDDLLALSIWLRLLLYSIGCGTLVISLLSPSLSNAPPVIAICVQALVALAMLWVINLYNFMDGIDGFAALQCVSACSGVALLSWLGGASTAYTNCCLLLAVSHLGFLLWNWPPAKLFMGDAGSIPTGFLLAGLAMLGELRGYVSVASWLVLLSVFIADASWTLCRRIVRREAFTQAHREHAYQRLSRRWRSHLAVDRLLLLVHLLWLLPLALAAQVWPDHALIVVILAYLPVLYGVAKVGEFA